MHAWVVIDALVGLQFVKLVLLNASVGPVNVPVDVLVRVEAELVPATRLFDDAILSLGSTKNEFLDSLLNLLTVVVLLLIFVLPSLQISNHWVESAFFWVFTSD